MGAPLSAQIQLFLKPGRFLLLPAVDLLGIFYRSQFKLEFCHIN